jgi:hypothetical protein
MNSDAFFFYSLSIHENFNNELFLYYVVEGGKVCKMENFKKIFNLKV